MTVRLDRVTAQLGCLDVWSTSSRRCDSRGVWGPHRIGYHLGLNRSTVERVLARYRMPKLVYLDQPPVCQCGAPSPMRYERATPGELVHVDIKKQGRIPDGGGIANSDARSATTTNAGAGQGLVYSFLHHAVDDHTRLAYSEILGDEKELGSGIGPTPSSPTDNGSCYRSRTFAAALGSIDHVWTGPYRPQTNGKVERFNRTLAPDGLTPTPNSPTKRARPPIQLDCITIITTDPTPASAAKDPQTASTTSVGMMPAIELWLRRGLLHGNTRPLDDGLDCITLVPGKCRTECHTVGTRTTPRIDRLWRDAARGHEVHRRERPTERTQVIHPERICGE